MSKSVIILCALLTTGTSALGAPVEGDDRAHHRHQRLLAEFDADQDGRLSESERRAARETIKARHEARKAELLAEFDTDGDGEISRYERRAARKSRAFEEQRRDPRHKRRQHVHQRLLDRFDANNDGELSADERQAAREVVEARKAEHRERLLEAFDADGSGDLDEAERRAARKAVHARRRGLANLRPFDANGDRTLSAEEAVPLLEAIASDDPAGDVNGDGVTDQTDAQVAASIIDKPAPERRGALPPPLRQR